jgi:monothiol glutaredoxin
MNKLLTRCMTTAKLRLPQNKSATSLFILNAGTTTAGFSTKGISKEESDSDFASIKKKDETSDVVSSNDVSSKIQELLKSNRVVIFIKGTADAPQCGFSKAVVKILVSEEVDDYVFVDVLKSSALREGIKKFTDWPTIPQIFIDGEFIGGCDILIELHKSGELHKMLKSKNII